MFAAPHFSVVSSYLYVVRQSSPSPPAQCIQASLTALVMSISLGPDDLGYLPPSPQHRSNYIARRRTVSTSFEQVRHEKVHIQVRDGSGGHGGRDGLDVQAQCGILTLSSAPSISRLI